ncbi:MAG: hypothetical protein SXA11_06325 [Cyanobacteriota bacterium]|nr:hypothetical protein [Cyanobacteriota bacterium]
MNIWKRFPLTALLATVLAALLFFPADAMAAVPFAGVYTSVSQSTFKNVTKLNILKEDDEDANTFEGELIVCNGEETRKTVYGFYHPMESNRLESKYLISFSATSSDEKNEYEAWAGISNDNLKILDLMGARAVINGEDGSICPTAALFVKTREDPENNDDFNCNS